MKSGFIAASLMALVASPLAAEDAERPGFAERISDHILSIERTVDGSFRGPGWDRLIEEGEKAQFFLIGENHATAEIAEMETRIHAALASRNYDYMAVELGPWSTRHTESLVRKGPGALESYIATPGNQFTLPFLFFREEIGLVEQAVALSRRKQQVLWGVDQEFLGAGSIVAQDLMRLAQTEPERAAAERFVAGSRQNPMFLGVAPDSEIDALEVAFADGSPEARELVRSIRLTHRVYGPFMRRTGPIYPANLERENYMKANFLQHFAQAEERDGETPKVFFKFGGYHMERGLSGTNVPSFGNFVMEWGRSRGFGTVHLMIDCLGGEVFAIMAGGPQPCTSYSLKEGSPLIAAIGDRDLALVDLAALRPLITSKTDLDERTKDLILSFDYFLVIRGVTPATPAADLTVPKM